MLAKIMLWEFERKIFSLTIGTEYFNISYGFFYQNHYRNLEGFSIHFERNAQIQLM